MSEAHKRMEAQDLLPNGTVLRVFRAVSRPGQQEMLAEKLTTRSVAVVRGKPGNLGYFAAGPGITGACDFIFCSIWTDADALADCFGAEWQSPLLPDGYEKLIETCSVDHFSTIAGALFATPVG